MSTNGTRKWTKIPAPVSLVVFVIGAAAIVVAAVLFFLRPGLKGDQSKVAADAIPIAARIDRLDGDIGIARQTGSQAQPYQGWTKATVNSPVSIGDRIYVKDGSKAAIAFSSRNYARLNPGTSLDVVSLTPRHTQLALRQGACVIDVGALASDEVFEIGTPDGAVDITKPGLYQVGIDDGGDAVVSVLSGLAHVSGLAGSCDVSKGQLLTLAAAETAEAVVSALSPDVAGTIVDDYYSYRYPTTYDGRYADYHAYEEDPYYYDESYRRSVSYRYIPDDTEIAGLGDLDDYGDWEDVPNYGHCWHPRNTPSEWAPYRDGYWSNDNTIGLTWVSNERWGWAPYHYGRWAHVDQNWYWVPADAVSQPVYAPALVAFVPLPRADEIAWVPLGPGDPYVPRYYDQDRQPRYVGPSSYVDKYVNVANFVNYHDSAAVTVVSVTQFTEVITPSTVLRPDPGYLASGRPVVDAFAVPVIRQLAPTMEASRPAVSVPVEAQQVLARPIVVRQQPSAPPVAVNVAETLKVQPIPEDKAKRKLQVKSVGETAVATRPNGLPAVPPEAKNGQLTDQERQARIAELSAQAAQGNKAAKREMRQLEQQQRQQTAQQAVAQQQQQTEQRKAEKQAARAQEQQAEQQRQAQAAQEAEQRKAQKRAARQQAQQAEQQRQAQAAQEADQRKAQKRAARQQAQQTQQPEQQRQPQPAQQPQQRKAQKQAARQQAQQAEQQRQAQAAQQAEQRKAEKRAAQQQQAQQAEQQRQAQASQQAEQRKAEKRAAQQQQQQQQAQQAEQQRQAQAAQQAEQRKAEKRAAQQQQAQQEAARQQAQQEQRRVQKQAQQQAQEQAQQQRQQQKAEKRSQRQNAEQQSQPQANPGKAERKAEKAKNKNKNSSQ